MTINKDEGQDDGNSGNCGCDEGCSGPERHGPNERLYGRSSGVGCGAGVVLVTVVEYAPRGGAISGHPQRLKTEETSVLDDLIQ
jgi:hypothetical protein